MNMALEPTSQQLSQLQNLPPGELALAQFLAVKDPESFVHYRSASARAVENAGGQRTHDVHIDQFLAGGDMHYSALTVDVFPTPKIALNAFDALNAERRAALADIYALIVRPNPQLPRIAKALRFLAPLLRQMLRTTSEKEIPQFCKVANPQTGPIPETIAVMRQQDQTTPFYMMNLNKYYPTAQYKNKEVVTGERAYNRYAARITPFLISVGGYPDIYGHVMGVFVGDANSPVHDDWNDFTMVYYPSRRNFIRMMTNSPRKGVLHREAGLQRALLMPMSNWV